MTSKSDPRGHPGLKLCVHVSVMGCYRFTNFRRNRRGSGSKWHFFGWFHMEWPFCKSRNHWVSIHTSNFNKIGQSDPEIRRWGGGGASAHVQRCPIPPMTCGKHVLSDPQPTYQIWTQSAKPILRYRSAVCTCARAEIPHPWLVWST